VGVDELFLPLRRHLLDPRGVVEQDAEIADAPDAGVEAGGRLAGLDPGEAQDALLRLARRPVV